MKSLSINQGILRLQFYTRTFDEATPNLINPYSMYSMTCAIFQVTPIQIEYAKQAKKIDVKKLKGTMWGIISQCKDDSQVCTSSYNKINSLSLLTTQ